LGILDSDMVFRRDGTKDRTSCKISQVILDSAEHVISKSEYREAQSNNLKVGEVLLVFYSL